MAENSAVAVAPTAAPTMLEELLEITAQSLVRTEVAEHYEVIRELGRGKYGHVMLVTHRQRGKELAAPYKLLCLVSSPLAHMCGLMGLGCLVPGVSGDSQGNQQSRGLPARDLPIAPSQGVGDDEGTAQSNRQDCDDDVSPRASWEVSPPSQDQQGSWPCIHMDIIQLKTSTPTTQHRQGMKPWA